MQYKTLYNIYVAFVSEITIIKYKLRIDKLQYTLIEQLLKFADSTILTNEFH